MTDNNEAERVVEIVQTAVTETIRFSRAGERLTTVASDLHRAILGLQALVEADPDLAPEIGATLEGLQAANDAVTRATVFVSTRLQTSLERALDGPLPGWPL